MSDVFNPLTAESMREHLQANGYRAELVTDPVANVQFVRSATNGLTFDVRMGNKLATEQLGYADATFVAMFNIVGDFSLEPINAWNCSRRFGRLQIDSSNPGYKFLMLCMDIVVAGGISRQNLGAQVAIWEGLVQQLTLWLREQVAKPRAADAAAAISADIKPSEPGVAVGASG
jgi:hypothetical protein